jgi:hypothetical protein
MTTENPTPWFPLNTKPVRVGVYEVNGSLGWRWFSWWSGRSWFIPKVNRNSAAKEFYSSSDQDRTWRGITKEGV